ncbi:hypothetical protein J5X84_02355 [Streptosporangiaceae bacterium NEAU-GS5]|nr:hypothetical protein [Streptosporangiaceae bacterium NEAU-GS5]
MPAADKCPLPPHASHAPEHIHHEYASGHDDDEQGENQDGYLKLAALATWRWFRASPAARTPLLAGPALYGGGALAHAHHLPGWGIGLATVAGSIVTHAYAMHRLEGWRSGGATAATAASGLWLAGAAEAGVTAGPSGLLSWLFWGGFGIGYALHRIGLKPRTAPEPETPEQPEAPRIDWDTYFPGWGLTGAAVLKAEQTRLGERVLIDTRGTGKRASTLAQKGLEERIAEDFQLPRSRVRVNAGAIAGQLTVSLRLTDPWATPIVHPVLDLRPEIELPEIADIRQPLVIGQDPETGRPLTLTVWDEDGAAHVMVVAMKGGGKSTLLNNVFERLTAADNVATIGIDVSKAKDMRRWRSAGALALSACGPKERYKAVKILELIAKIVSLRAEHNTDAVFHPRPGHPLIEVVIDEIDALFKGNDAYAQRAREALTTITSKGRSESVGGILVGQRGSAQWLGDANIRANLDRFVFLKVARQGEMGLAAGEMGLELPNMAEYGEGKPGVVAIADVSGGHDKGRTFNLSALDDVSRVAEGREPSPLEPELWALVGPAWTALAANDDDSASNAVATAGAIESDDHDPELPSTSEERTAARRSIVAHLALVPPLDDDTATRVREHSRQRHQLFAAVEGGADAEAGSAVPAEVRARIVAVLLERGEAPMRVLQEEIGYSPAHMLRLMNQLRADGAVSMRGLGPATRWHLPDAPPEATDGSQRIPS